MPTVTYGTIVPAGPWHSTVLAGMDFESYSEAGLRFDGAKFVGLQRSGKAGLPAVGNWHYATHPSTEVLTFAYDLKEGNGRRVWYPGMPNPSDLFAHLNAGRLIEAVNGAAMEVSMWLCVCVPRYGWPVIDPRQVVDISAKCAAHALPRGLESAGKVLGLPPEKLKDPIGHKVMLRLCKPRKPTKKDARLRYTREEDPEDFATLDAYCGVDVSAEDEVSIRVPDLTPQETQISQVSDAINMRGVLCDRHSVECAADIIRQAEIRYHTELRHISGGVVNTADELGNMKKFLLSRGIDAPKITKDTLPELLRLDMPPDAHRVLEIRALMRSKSVTKTAAMLLQMCPDDRIRGLYTYAGASRTRRWSGNGVQTQNLPNKGPDVAQCKNCQEVHWAGLGYCPRCYRNDSRPTGWGIEAAESCLNAIHTRSLDVLETLWGDALTAIAGCLRSFFMAGPGMELVCSDLSAIEAVVIAILAGEEWRLEVFRTHGRIYEASAAKLFGVPYAEFARYKAETGMNHPLRAVGKVAELASGFGGWIRAWRKFGAGEKGDKCQGPSNQGQCAGYAKLCEGCKLIKLDILKWRQESPAIVKLWEGLELAAVSAVLNPGQTYGYRGIFYQTRGDVLYAQLPSGRAIPYHTPRVRNTTRYDKPHRELSYSGWSGGRWSRQNLYGGKLAQGATQATARDIFAAGLVRSELAGYLPVLHCHDEVTAEMPTGTGSVEVLNSILKASEPWCAEYPIRSEGWSGVRYRKE